ncbi:hypothetical protein L1887_10670 [Cichorium endivia]|nr:hypothetical protein L1887_10670 [Cichorium endivia]
MASAEGPDPDPDPHLKPQPSVTFVQADPSSFRAVVQRLTGDTTHKLPISNHSSHTGKPTLTEVGRRRSCFKLHERRKTAKKLEISQPYMSPAVREGNVIGYVGGDGEMVASPVSTLAVCGVSPGTPTEDEEIRAIAEKGFYLHPSPVREREPEPELLLLFPLKSPKKDPSYSS